jgi:PilZ domain
VSFITRFLRFHGADAGSNADQSSSNRRLAGRVLVDNELRCNLGRVIDLSGGGLRVLSRWPREGLVRIELRDDDGGFACEAKVTRSCRLGFFRHEIGIQLSPLDDQQRATMTRFCSMHRERLSMLNRNAA